MYALPPSFCLTINVYVCTDVQILLLYSYWRRVTRIPTECRPYTNHHKRKQRPDLTLGGTIFLFLLFICIVHTLLQLLCACVLLSPLCYCLLVLPDCHGFMFYLLFWGFPLRSMYVSFQHSGFLFFFFSVFSMIAFCGIFVLLGVPSSLIQSFFSFKNDESFCTKHDFCFWNLHQAVPCISREN